MTRGVLLAVVLVCSVHPAAASAQAVGFATITAVHVGDVGALWVTDPSSVPPVTGPVLVEMSNGRRVSITPEEGQVQFRKIQLSPNRADIGWEATENACAQELSVPDLSRGASGDGSRNRFTPGEGVVWDWSFSRDGQRIILFSGFPHGDTIGDYELFDLGTGARLARYSVKKDSPQWVRDFISRFSQ